MGKGRAKEEINGDKVEKVENESGHYALYHIMLNNTTHYVSFGEKVGSSWVQTATNTCGSKREKVG